MKQHGKSVFLSVVLSLLPAAAPAWNPAPWLADLKQIRTSIERDYPNLDWLTGQREVSLDQWVERTADTIRNSHDDADARRALDGLIERFNDGHLALYWPSPTLPKVGGDSMAISPSPTTLAGFCAARDYDGGRVTIGTAASLPGYRPIEGDGPFRSGIVSTDGTTVGVIRIGAFSPQGYPMLCEQAVTSARIAFNMPCDAACDDRILTETYSLITRELITTVERLRTAGAQVLLVDVSRNGGGTEWAEAAARIISPVSLRSAPIEVLRGDAWSRRWRELADKLRKQSPRASRVDRRMLLKLAKQADATADGLKPCAEPTCSRLAGSGFASGLIAELPAGTLDGKTWGADVFSAAQFPYRDSVWKGPVIVLVDSETWSAAEQFTALLRDNSAAIVMGARTGGAGCGHLYGNDPITLSYSRATLEMPNCARLRRDSSNEVSGIVPDIPTGVRSNDGAAYAGRLTAVRLPDAITKAYALIARKSR